MASRRFIQKFDRLTDDARHHVEAVVDLLHEMGYTVESPDLRLVPTDTTARLQRLFISFDARRKRQLSRQLTKPIQRAIGVK